MNYGIVLTLTLLLPILFSVIDNLYVVICRLCNIQETGQTKKEMKHKIKKVEDYIKDSRDHLAKVVKEHNQYAKQMDQLQVVNVQLNEQVTNLSDQNGHLQNENEYYC